MELLLSLGLWFLMGLWASKVMAGKGRSSGAGWALGLFLGPIGVLIAYVNSSQ